MARFKTLTVNSVVVSRVVANSIVSFFYVRLVGVFVSGEREPLRLREAARDADPHEHGGPARDDALQALRALPPQQAQADGLLRRRDDEVGV